MKVNANLDCAIVVSTCDAYNDLWSPFFTLFQRFWSDNPYPVYVNSETLDCNAEDVKITTLKATDTNVSWTRRLMQALDRIDAEYIIFMLDDFFLYDKVDTAQVIQCIEYMRKNTQIGGIYFSRLEAFTEQCDLPGLEKLKDDAITKVNLTMGLFRKSTFLYYLNHDESAWEYEINSLDRSLDRSETFYAFSRHTPVPIPYSFNEYGLIAGKWFKQTESLFEKLGIKHDFSLRGFHEDYEFGQIPYVSRQIKMDSYLVPCFSLTKDNPRIESDIIVDEGSFKQTYDVSGAKNALFWCPSPTYYGHVIEDFKCDIIYKSGKIESLAAEDVYGNFSLYEDVMYFLTWGTHVYILPKSQDEMSSITICGYMTKNSTSLQLATAFELGLREIPHKKQVRLNESRLYAENLLMPQSFVCFRVYSKLCFSYDNKFDETKDITDGADRFPGVFLQTYILDKVADRLVKWKINGTFGGFAIQKLSVEMVFDDGTTQQLDEEHIHGIECNKINSLWVVLTTSAYLQLALPGNPPDKLRISGIVLAPMPREVLRLAVFSDLSNIEENANLICSTNSERFFKKVPRVIKKYGLLGVIKEIFRRVFHK